MNHYRTLCIGAALTLIGGLANATGPSADKESRKASLQLTTEAQEACKLRSAGVDKNTCLMEYMAGHTTDEGMKKDGLKRDAPASRQ